MPADDQQPTAPVAPETTSCSTITPPKRRTPGKSVKPDRYRDSLIECSNAAIDEYAKTVVLLSGGALGVSFTFVKDILDPENIVSPFWLLWAWVCWALSVTCILLAHYSSHKAHEKAIVLHDAAKPRPDETRWNRITTECLTPGAGILFLAGLLCMGFFVKAHPPYGKRTKTGKADTTNSTSAAFTPTGAAPNTIQRPGSP